LGGLRQALGENGAAPLAALDTLVAQTRGTPWEMRGRLVVAEKAYRAGDPETVRRALATGRLERRDFLAGYGEYLLGLTAVESGGNDAHAHFTRAFERAGATLVRHRAGV